MLNRVKSRNEQRFQAVWTTGQFYGNVKKIVHDVDHWANSRHFLIQNRRSDRVAVSAFRFFTNFNFDL
ncbi:hypothetical protein FHW16_003672 [Phyllobacterium myrsinacearum]|uniref:Uncharacterized protein n=1 Tax=Phyllobacterium myrsinacearum TaxID=28101 RepID=A0A839EI21_9HYPH|nr:hypothetical protein [Phyllobacterium myrsinacearum]